jgi:hypothetical protein
MAGPYPRLFGFGESGWAFVSSRTLVTVLAGLGPANHEFLSRQPPCGKHVDARTKSGQDDFLGGDADANSPNASKVDPQVKPRGMTD